MDFGALKPVDWWVFAQLMAQLVIAAFVLGLAVATLVRGFIIPIAQFKAWQKDYLAKADQAIFKRQTEDYRKAMRGAVSALGMGVRKAGRQQQQSSGTEPQAPQAPTK